MPSRSTIASVSPSADRSATRRAGDADLSHPQDDAHAVVERLGSALATAGFPPMPSRIFAALLVDEDGRMTAAELIEELSISAAAVSGGVRYLARIGLLRRERERGGRRDVFVVLDDAWHGVMTSTDQTYAPILAALAKGVDHFGVGTRAGDRLQLSREFLEFVSAEMTGISERWDAYKRTR